MKKNFFKKNILLIILIIVFLLILSFYVVREYIASKTIYIDSTLTDEMYEMIPKTYDVNEYINISVSDEDMARIYLNDYIDKTIDNVEESYYLLDEEYRNLRFKSINEYIEYISTINNREHNATSYFKKKIKGNIIYGVIDEDGNFFIFKTKGVMQYIVYLDEYTVEIW